MTPNYTKHDTGVIVDNFVEMGDFSKNLPFLFVDRKRKKEKTARPEMQIQKNTWLVNQKNLKIVQNSQNSFLVENLYPEYRI